MYTAYLAAPQHTEDLLDELKLLKAEVLWQRERLLLCKGDALPAAWAQNVWYDAQIKRIASIKDAAVKLRALQRNWALYSICEHRRAALIQEQLPPVGGKALVFGDPAPRAPLGSWSLLDRETLLFSQRCQSPFVHGEARFVEDKEGPPNRAYLKLWEVFTLLGKKPGPGDFCLDLGGSPGGWSWVLQGLGARVLCIDKAPLSPQVAGLSGVTYRQGSAFALDTGELSRLGVVDWLCCDVVCYPRRLLEHVQRWLSAGSVHNFICTLKFQGATDHATAREFASLPGSRLLHLWWNKHELTWIRLEDKAT